MAMATVEHHDPIGDGPALTDFIVRVDAEELEALGEGPAGRADLAEFTHAAVWALILLRTLERQGSFDCDKDDDLAHLRGLIDALERRLLPRMNGIRDAAVRWHTKLGGSYGDLAGVMGVARSTAQTRVQALKDHEPSEDEQWARGLNRPAPEATPGPQGVVTVDLNEDKYTYFVLTTALEEWAHGQRGEAQDELADDERDTTAAARLKWAETADKLLDRIERAL